MFKTRIKIALLFALQLCWWGIPYVAAQCSQCKAAAGATDEDGNLVVGGTLNTGVLFLLTSPFILAFGVYLVWRYMQKTATDPDTAL
ncbi:MAG: hypothetical protein AAFR61_19595 [Bacteroidota bacterium]